MSRIARTARIAFVAIAAGIIALGPAAASHAATPQPEPNSHYWKYGK
jgi:hypothetical protein